MKNHKPTPKSPKSPIGKARPPADESEKSSNSDMISQLLASKSGGKPNPDQAFKEQEQKKKEQKKTIPSPEKPKEELALDKILQSLEEEKSEEDDRRSNEAVSTWLAEMLLD